MNRRRAVTLLLVLTSLALAAALIVPLATISGVHALTSSHESESLRHRLAGDSLIAVLPEWLEHDRAIERELDRANRAELAFELAGISVSAVLQDDSAKLPLGVLYERRDPRRVELAIGTLSAGTGLPRLELAELKGAPSCLDDLFESATDAELFGDPAALCRYVTTLGRTVNVRSADPVVLEALLTDVKPGAGQSIARQRARKFDSLEQLLAPLELPEVQRRAVQERLTMRTERYSLLIRTSRGDQVRHRYVILSASEPAVVILDWEVAF